MSSASIASAAALDTQVIEITPFSEPNLGIESQPPATEGPNLTASNLQSPRAEREEATSPLIHPLENSAASESHAKWEEVFHRPTNQSWQPDEGAGGWFPFPLGPCIPKAQLLALLPPADCCDYLVTQYFLRISPVFHVLHGPTFQRQYNSFRDDPLEVQFAWLALLFTICSLTLYTVEDDPTLSQMWPIEDSSEGFLAIAARYRQSAMICLSQDRFLSRYSLNTLEALLIMIYGMSHSDGVEHTWVLLGMALNIGIALRCNIKAKPPNMGWIDSERRRRCWAGILMLHTYQAILFRDVNISLLLDMGSTMPADLNDEDIHDDAIGQAFSRPTQMSLVMFKLQLFQLSSRICNHLSSPSRHDEGHLMAFDEEIAREQVSWDAAFLIDGKPSLLDSSSFFYWCILQQYAHQLYLLLHRTFCRPLSGNPPRVQSQQKCILSGAALLEIHRQLYETPRLQPYRWYIYGMTSFCALHGAVALVSCLLMESCAVDPTPYKAAFNATVERFKVLQSRSSICAKSYSILSYLQ
ncbi:transcriptional regulator family: Fungal Specific TF [Aspergillus niger]|nr:transcriptional regulator family: Fungal Specific TF [Aspergillus niger]